MDSSSPKRHLGATLVSDTTSQRKGGVTMKLSRIGIDLTIVYLTYSKDGIVFIRVLFAHGRAANLRKRLESGLG